MNRVAAGNDTISTDWGASIWKDDWLLVAAKFSGKRWPRTHGVVAMNPDGRRQRVRLPSLNRHTLPTVVAMRLVVREQYETHRGEGRSVRTVVRERNVEVGIAFGTKYGPYDSIRVNPLKRVPTPEGVLAVYHSATQDAGPLTVCTRSHYRAYPANKWCPEPIRSRIGAAFDAAGDTGFVVFNRETGALRTLDLQEEVVRVEIRPDGLVAAAFLKDNAVAFFDLGDD